jgi:hypothetical protein
MCIAILLVVNSVEAAHFCELRAAFARQGPDIVQGSAPNHSEPTFCMICVNSHAPSLTASSAQLSPVSDSNEFAISVPVNEFFSSPLFGLHVRPPPAA